MVLPVVSSEVFHKGGLSAGAGQVVDAEDGCREAKCGVRVPLAGDVQRGGEA